MQKHNKLILILIFLGFIVNLDAQTTILDQSMLTQQSFDTFTQISVTGDQTWHQNTSYGAVCSGYILGQNYDNEDWLISPGMDLSQADNAQLTFSHTRGSVAVVNVGVAEGWYKVYATADFTGDPLTTQWIELEGFSQTVPVAWQYVSSGGLVIPAAAKSEHSRIAFRYISSASQSASWEIKNVKVTGEIHNTSTFKITNWNLEWLGCTTFGPTDENLQINNVVSAMLSMNSDIYCVQEVSNTVSNPSIETIISLMGSDQWGGTIIPSDTGDCNQRQGLIYKKSKVQFVSSLQMNSGNAAQGNSYYYNWSSGRYPALYNVNLVSGSTLIPISLVNIHAKAEDNDPASYTRRLGASEALKTILDGSGYNSKKLIVIGDFNDYLIGTSSSACSCTVSPYQNFMDDDGNYIGITKNIFDLHTGGVHPIIEHMIVSDELAANYIEGSIAQEAAVAQNISNYYYTTSDHLPVSATFEFSLLSSVENTFADGISYTIYPNPASDQLKIGRWNLKDDATAEICDLTGRLMFCEKLSGDTIDVSTFPAGVYILKIGNTSGKFVKK